ncbi:MAG: hypothetical protein IGR76_10055 [Synechococcales cyanobacterium T60_A2020_003]|nr:hypothetical protein [Synechococcales cyanobacterium T60_A2020_003]
MTKTRQIKTIVVGLMAIAPSLVISTLAQASPVLEDDANSLQNNSADTAEVLEPDVTHVLGHLGLLADPADYDDHATGVLKGDRADTITFTDLPAGEPFFAWIDNSSSGIDTVLGVFDQTGAIVNVNDDGSPLGTGVASGVSGQVKDDGTVVLGVSGFPDFNFDGQFTAEEAGMISTTEEPSEPVEPLGGDYTLYVQIGVTDPNSIDSQAADYFFPGRIQAELLGELTLSDSALAEPFVAWVDNSSSGVDTVMGLFSTDGRLMLVDDDGSFVGSGLGSAIASTTEANGTLTLQVSAFPDFNFNGQYDDDNVDAELTQFPPQPHGGEGEYEVFIKLGIDQIAGDVDFYTYSDLEPGQPFTAEVMLANFDSRLGWFDDAGHLVQLDDDSGDGTLSSITGTVPESGNLTVAVTGFEDEGFVGNHTVIGDYVLRLTVAP